MTLGSTAVMGRPAELPAPEVGWGDFESLFDLLVLELHLMALAFIEVIVRWQRVAENCQELAACSAIFCRRCENGF